MGIKVNKDIIALITCDVCKTASSTIVIPNGKFSDLKRDDGWLIDNITSIIDHPSMFSCKCPICVDKEDRERLNDEDLYTRVLSSKYDKNDFWDDLKIYFNLSINDLRIVRNTLYTLNCDESSLNNILSCTETLIDFAKEFNKK